MNTIVCLVGVFLLICAPCAYSKQLNDTAQTQAIEKANDIFRKQFKDGKLGFDEKLVAIAMETACGKPPKEMGIVAYGAGTTSVTNIVAHHDLVACIEKKCEKYSILCVVASSKAPEKAAEKPDEKSDGRAQKIIGFSLVVLILGVLNY